MRDLDDPLFRQEGVLARRQALAYLSDKAIRHRLATRRWQPAHRGVYLTHTGPVGRAQRLWVAVLAAGPDGSAVLAGASALEVLGMQGYVRRELHILLPLGRRDFDPPAGVVVHRTRHIAPEDLHRLGSPPCTRAARSLVDAARWAPDDDAARTLVAAGFQQRLVAADDVYRVLERMPNLRRHAVISQATADAVHGAESLSEAQVLRLCRRAGLPEPARQAVRVDAAGRKRYRDVYFPEWGVQVEIDPGQHIEVRAWVADMTQQNELVIAGVRLLRFPVWLVRNRPDQVVAQIRAALCAGGWPG